MPRRLNRMRKNVHSVARRAGRKRGKCRPPQRAAYEWSLYSSEGRRKYLNGEERRRFIAAAMQAAPKVRTLCLTLAYSGCRLSEALNLTAYDVEVSGGLIAVRSLKKRGKIAIRQVPAPPGLLADLADVHGLAEIYRSEPARRLWTWHRTRAWQLVKAVMAVANVYHLPASPKGLRHGFGVHAVLSGVPLTMIQKWLGHANIATTAIYLDVLGPEERAIAERMW